MRGIDYSDVIDISRKIRRIERKIQIREQKLKKCQAHPSFKFSQSTPAQQAAIIEKGIAELKKEFYALIKAQNKALAEIRKR